jgi:hypothetical protein
MGRLSEYPEEFRQRAVELAAAFSVKESTR